MVLIDTVSFKVDDNVDHLATDWEVSDSINFDHILLSSYEDYKNKNGIIFSDNLNTNVKYYARARGLLTTGYTKWGNIDVFSIINDADLLPQDILPTRVSTPILNTYRINTTAGVNSLLLKNNQDPTPDSNPAPDLPSVAPEEGATGSNQNFDEDVNVKSLLENIDKTSHDLTLFEIWATGFETIGTAKHLATTWWIENKDGDIIWSKIKDQINLTRIEFNNTILKSDELYRIKAVFHTNSNDVSQIGAMTIVTGYCGEVELVSYLDAVDASLDLDLQIAWLSDLTTVNWEIISFEGNLLNSIWATTTSAIVAQVPKGTLKRNVNYILRISTNLADCYKYIPFVTTSTVAENPNDPITSLLVYPTDITVYKGDTAELFIESEVDSIQFINNDPSIFEYDEITHLFRGIKRGSGSMTIIAKKEGFAENFTKINVRVEEDTQTTPNGKYVRVNTSNVQVPQGEHVKITVTTNCDSLTFQQADDTISVEQLTDTTFDIVGIDMGKTSIIIIGYTKTGETASAIVDIEVTKGSLDPDEPDEPDVPPEYTFEVDKTELEIAGDGGIGNINVITNAMFWDVMSISHPDIIDVEKASVNTLRVIGKIGGTSRIYLVANDGENDVGNIEVLVTVGKVALSTTFTPLDLTYHTEINADVIIDFASNITSPSEYDVKYDTSLLQLKLKGAERLVFTVKESAAGQTIPITVRAQKDETPSGIYAAIDVYINVVVKNLTHAKDEVIRLPDPAADGKRYYTGTTYENQTPFAPNPIPYYFYVNRQVTVSDVVLNSSLWEDKTGQVVNTILDANVVTDKNSKFFNFRKFSFDLVTNPDDNKSDKGIENSNHIFNLVASVTYDNDTHVEKFQLEPLDQLYLTFTLMDNYITKGSFVSANIYSNATSIEMSSNNKTVAILANGEYTEDGMTDPISGYYIEAKDYGTAKLTAIAKNEGNERIVAEQTVTVYDPNVTTSLTIDTRDLEVGTDLQVPFSLTTDAETLTYEYDDQFISIDEANKIITGKVVGNVDIKVIANKKNGKPVTDYISVYVYNKDDIPKDITPENNSLIVDSEGTVSTNVTVFRGTTLTSTLDPDVGSVTIEDITPPDPVPDPDETTGEDTVNTGEVVDPNDPGTTEDEEYTFTPLYSKFKITYTAPFSGVDLNTKITLNGNYQTVNMNPTEINVKVNKVVPPTGMTTDVEELTVESNSNGIITLSVPDGVDVSTELDPNIGTVDLTKK